MKMDNDNNHQFRSKRDSEKIWFNQH